MLFIDSFQGAPGNRGFPGQDGLAGAKVGRNELSELIVKRNLMTVWISTTGLTFFCRVLLVTVVSLVLLGQKVQVETQDAQESPVFLEPEYVQKQARQRQTYRHRLQLEWLY